MSNLTLRIITSPQELRRHREAWDDLWQRSRVALPLARAEILALWLEQFARGARFQALVIQQDGRFLAALPLVSRRRKGVVPVLELPNNPWSSSGELLLDPACDHHAVLDRLIDAITRQRRPLLWLEGVNCAAPYWQAFLWVAQERGLHWDRHNLYTVGVIDIDPSWESYTAALTSKFRSDLRRRRKKLSQQGQAEMQVLREFSPESLEDQLRRAFAVEDQSWKGDAGTSLLRTPGMFDYYLRKSQLLAQWNQLALHFLNLGGEPVAFEYGYWSKATYFAHKISYLSEYSNHAPGNLLRWSQLEAMSGGGEIRCFDTFGPMTEAISKWITDQYACSRLVVSTDSFTSRMLMCGYTQVRPKLKQLLGGAKGEDRACTLPETETSSEKPEQEPQVAAASSRSQ